MSALAFYGVLFALPVGIIAMALALAATQRSKD
jgi:hypothetical protein